MFFIEPFPKELLNLTSLNPVQRTLPQDNLYSMKNEGNALPELQFR